jgi:hypothetical protein
MLAMLFQIRERMVHAGEYPLLSSADIVELVRHFLPAGSITKEGVYQQMQVRQRKRQASIPSAYRWQFASEEPPEQLL